MVDTPSRTRRRLTIAAVVCGCAVLASVILHWEALRDHAAGWAFLIDKDTVEISPKEAENPGRRPVLAMVNAIDFKERLAILSAGEEQGVMPRDQFLIAGENGPVGLVRIIKVYPEMSGARIMWSKKGQEIRKGDQGSMVNLVHALARAGGVPVILDASAASDHAERPPQSFEDLGAGAVLEVLRENGWRVVEQRVPRRAYIVLDMGHGGASPGS